MTDNGPPTWTLPEHLREGRAAINAIASEAPTGAEPVCHHFSPVAEIEMDRLLMEDGYAESVYGQLEALVGAEGLEFLLDRLEAWETCAPTLEWLQERVPMLVEIAANNQLIYEGWTWEPADRQPIGACTFSVINNRQAAAS